MKKALIAIISAIYIIAIIIVSFLGARAEISNRIIYAEEIVLLNESMYYQGLPQTEENMIIGVYKRPEENMIDSETGKGYADEINWNEGETKRDYAIFIYDYNEVYDKMGKKYALKTSVKPDNTTKKDLDYFVSGGEKVIQTMSIDTHGEITFDTQYTRWVGVDIVISTTDLSGKEITVQLKVNKYE